MKSDSIVLKPPILIILAAVLLGTAILAGCSGSTSASNTANTASNAANVSNVTVSNASLASNVSVDEIMEYSPFVAFWDVESVVDGNGIENSDVKKASEDPDIIYCFSFYPSGNVQFRFGNTGADGTWSDNGDETATVMIPYLSKNASIAKLSDDGSHLIIESGNSTLTCKCRTVELGDASYETRIIPVENDGANYKTITEAQSSNTSAGE